MPPAAQEGHADVPSRSRSRHPFASFLVSGGAFTSTRVDLVLADINSVFYSITGADHPRLRPAVVDLSEATQAATCSFALIDEETGAPTAVYIKEVRGRTSTSTTSGSTSRARSLRTRSRTNEMSIAAADGSDARMRGCPALEAAKAMTLPKGFTVKLAASEPDVVRPIAFALDDRGTALGRRSPHLSRCARPRARASIPHSDPRGHQRRRPVSISRKVFMEGLNLVSGIEVGFGGVWVGAAPNLMFIPMKEGTDVPAGPPRDSSWTAGAIQDTHETLNTFTWGPDGWLYGTHGVFTHSKVGKPGAPDAERTGSTPACGDITRQKHQFEVFAEGTSNPWGLDFNDYGHSSRPHASSNTCFTYSRARDTNGRPGKHFNPNTYDDMKTIADHVHWVGQERTARGKQPIGGSRRRPRACRRDDLSWRRQLAARVSRQIFMNNIHGARANMDRLQRSGSGYAAPARTGFPARRTTHGAR